MPPIINDSTFEIIVEGGTVVQFRVVHLPNNQPIFHGAIPFLFIITITKAAYYYIINPNLK